MVQNEHTQGIYNIPEMLEQDLDKLRDMVQQVKDGTLSPERFRAFRVPQGVYEQREVGIFMLRVRCAAGAVLPHQMRTLADVSEQYGNGILHATTRQDIQIHRVLLDNIHSALVALYKAGLSTKGGGGNTVRNITACHHSGVCPDEIFDVAPYAVALTDFLLPDPNSFQLPRKYKIAFSGCSKDCAAATVNDLGLIAKRRDGVDGFAVYVAGGMGTKSRVASLLEEFVPAGGVHLVVEAIKRLFDKRGNRKNKHKARLRFLIEEVGFDEFRELYRKELDELRSASLPPLEPHLLPCREPAPAKGVVTNSFPDGFEKWRKRNVLPQKQEDYFVVEIPLFLGDVEANTMRALADIVASCGEGVLRTTQTQNLAIRWVSEGELPDLYAELGKIGLAKAEPFVLRNLVACAGASTCKLGICLSRGLAKAAARELSRSGIDLEELGDLKINISGCPNSCGRHPIAHIGLFGAARRIKEKLVPHYTVQLGGHVEEGKTKLARGKTTIAAKVVPALLKHLLRAYEKAPDRSDFGEFLEAEGMRKVEDFVSRCEEIPSFEEDKNFYFDWDAEEVFSLAGRGPGECGAGVFDLIEVDIASAYEALRKGDYYAAAALASRALLVTRGEQADDDLSAFTLFKKHFVDQNIVSAEFKDLIDKGIECGSVPDPESSFAATPDSVAALVDTVATLYENMDASLRFTSEDEPGEGQTNVRAPDEAVTADVSHDFRGVVCPLNYVKTKLALEQMNADQVLSVLLDEEGARNVSASASDDGHEVLSVAREDNHWRVVIRKSGGDTG